MSSGQLTKPYPLCEQCLTDEYLVYEDVRKAMKVKGVKAPIWDVECWCGKCETFYGFRATHPPKDPRAVQARRNTNPFTDTEPHSHFPHP
ncbi:hypothetical protein GCM10009628_10950 [Paeniglutamicibacter kerguelensis]|uniref:Uncharacterized protein n=1 Tax=Paeniglutamicibacter kerguelensis TaxID=254788 RepID=A0ABS4XCU6_9MICC|nr:hypothetical protein [Paeniglutamicibacter kerguelensis]